MLAWILNSLFSFQYRPKVLAFLRRRKEGESLVCALRNKHTLICLTHNCEHYLIQNLTDLILASWDCLIEGTTKHSHKNTLSRIKEEQTVLCEVCGWWNLGRLRKLRIGQETEGEGTMNAKTWRGTLEAKELPWTGEEESWNSVLISLLASLYHRQPLVWFLLHHQSWALIATS